MNIKCAPIKEIYINPDNGYRVLSCVPIESKENIKLNKYGNFTLSGGNLSNLQLNEEANIVIAEDSKSKYEASYVLLTYAGIGTNENGQIEIDEKFELEILSRLMSKEQAINVNTAYPRFINMVVNGEEDKIDYHNIYNVGTKRLPEYIAKVKKDCKVALFYPTCFKNGITTTSAVRELQSRYDMLDDLIKDLEEKPYHVYMDCLEYGFEQADRLVKQYHTDMIDSQHRCEYGCVEILKQNEYLGDTRLNANLMAKEAKKLMPEASHHMVQAVNESKVIYYDPKTKYAALRATYDAERTIADHILKRTNDKHLDFLPMDWTKFKEVDGVQFTEEQIKILKIVGEGARIALLTGSAGCVDCDTEFFTGNGWKRIADYEHGDRVLQYNMDGSAELVEPLAYIKKPCNSLWHFENKHGINQTVCEEHRILYVTNYEPNKIKETNVLAIKHMSDTNKNWSGKFINHYKLERDGMKLSDFQIRLMVAVMAEGRYVNKTDNKVRIRLKKRRKIERLEYLLKENRLDYKTNIDKYGVYNYVFYPPERRKVYGGDWWNANPHQLKIIEEEVVNWDGTIIESRANKKIKPCFRTTEKESADYIQYVFNNNGWQSTIIKLEKNNPNQKPVYHVSTSHTKYGSICFDNRPEKTKTSITQVPTTDGYKYCFTVPSSMLVLRRKNCVFITGNCGKTSSMKALVRMLEAHGKSYTLLAPTGIASKRLRESTGREASTIHMALASGIEPTDYLIIEESSMVSVHLLASLLNRIGYEPNLIFVCDEAQLASISCGNVLQDIINSNIVSRANLTKPFRYGTSGLITIATDTRNGRADNLLTEFDDFKFIQVHKDKAVDQVLAEYQTLLKRGYNKSDILILSPYNKGSKGTFEINRQIQAVYNPHEYSNISYKRQYLGEIQFKVGDRVLNTKNNYHMPYIVFDEEGYESEEERFCANGDIGVVRECRKSCTGLNELVVEFDNGLACVNGSNIQNLILGYTISVHKIQGSQAKAVIVLIDDCHKTLLSRNLLYVALSRAQEQMALISDVDVINEGLEVQENMERDTWLEDMLNYEKRNLCL